jgi:hypothetical protein
MRPPRSGEPSRSPPRPARPGPFGENGRAHPPTPRASCQRGGDAPDEGRRYRTPSGSRASSATKERNRCDHGARGPAARVSALRCRPRIGTSYGEPDPGDAVLPESQDGRSGSPGVSTQPAEGRGPAHPSVLLGRGARGGEPLTRHEPGAGAVSRSGSWHPSGRAKDAAQATAGLHALCARNCPCVNRSFAPVSNGLTGPPHLVGTTRAF